MDWGGNQHRKRGASLSAGSRDVWFSGIRCRRRGNCQWHIFRRWRLDLPVSLLWGPHENRCRRPQFSHQRTRSPISTYRISGRDRTVRIPDRLHRVSVVSRVFWDRSLCGLWGRGTDTLYIFCGRFWILHCWFYPSRAASWRRRL